MQPGDSTDSQGPAEPGVELERLSASARGWHTIQMAVLGFIGICGVLRTPSGSTPSVVQWLAAIVAVIALAVACLAIFTVGRVAYPVNLATDNSSGAHQIAQAAGRLRTGIRLTVLALILIVIAALSGWWPKTTGNTTSGTTTIALSDATGQTWCGPVVNGPDGTISIRTVQGVVAVPTQTVARLRPVTSCP
jgi:hypothetical protein